MVANSLIFKCNYELRLKYTAATAIRHRYTQTAAPYGQQYLIIDRRSDRIFHFAEKPPLDEPLSWRSL